jgi:hypothetical protein
MKSILYKVMLYKAPLHLLTFLLTTNGTMYSLCMPKFWSILTFIIDLCIFYVANDKINLSMYVL